VFSSSKVENEGLENPCCCLRLYAMESIHQDFLDQTNQSQQRKNTERIRTRNKRNWRHRQCHRIGATGNSFRPRIRIRSRTTVRRLCMCATDRVYQNKFIFQCNIKLGYQSVSESTSFLVSTASTNNHCIVYSFMI